GVDRDQVRALLASPPRRRVERGASDHLRPLRREPGAGRRTEVGMSTPNYSWRESGLKWIWIALVAVVLDQLTKFWIVASIPNGGSVYVLPVLNIIHTYNPGAAWSMFANAGGAQRWVFSALAVVVSVVLVYWLRRLALASQKLLITGLTLIL